MPPFDESSYTTANASSDLQQSIEPLAVASSEPLIDPRTNKPVVSTPPDHPKWKPNKAMLWTGMAILFATTLVILLILLVSVSRNNAAKDLDKQTYPNTEIPLTDLTVGDPLTLGQIGSLDVNGTVSVNGSLVLSPTAAPTNPATGQLFTDKTTNSLNYFDGSLTKTVAMLGDSITNVTGRRNQITATKTGTDVSLSLPQDIAKTSTPTFAELLLTKALSILNGGTGATTAEQARANLSVASSGANNDITSLGSLTSLKVQNTANQTILEVDSQNLTVKTGNMVPLEVGGVTPGISSVVLDPSEGAGVNGTALVRGPDGYMRIISSDNKQNLSYIRCTNNTCSTRVVRAIRAGVKSGYSGVAIKLGSDGFARMAYTGAAGTHDDLVYTRCTDEDCTSPISTVVDSTSLRAGNYGVEMEIASDGFARIAYYAGIYPTNPSTYFAQCTDIDCSSPVVTYIGNNTYGYDIADLAIGPDGFARIVYEGEDELLKFVRCTTADCSGKVIANPDPIIDRAYEGNAIAFGSDGFARIAYLSYPDDDWVTSQLWYARCTDIDCIAPVITKIADTSIMYNGFGFVLDSNDNPWFSFDEKDTRALYVTHCIDNDCSSRTTSKVALRRVETWPGEGASVSANSLALGIDGLPSIIFADGSTGLKFMRVLSSDGNSVVTNGTNIGSTEQLFGQAYLQGLSIKNASISSLISLEQDDIDGALMDFRYQGNSVGMLSARPNQLNFNGNLSIVGDATVSGTLKLNGSTDRAYIGIKDNNFEVHTYRDLSALSRGGNNVGTLEIVMPNGWTNTTMKIHISGYDWSGGRGAWDATVSGYNFAASTTWMMTSATITGNAPFTSVRLAYNGTKCVLLLGTTATTWSAPKITIDEVQTGHYVADWETGWSMNFITTEPIYTNIDTPPLTNPVLQRGNTLGVAMSVGTNDNFDLNFETNNTTRWSVLTSGELQSTGAQTIQSSTGNLTIATAAGNGNILLLPNGTGKVGIGAAPGAFKLDVVDAQASTYVARIQNTNTSNTADGLLIDLGVSNASRSTGNYFVGFAGAGVVAGKIQGGANSVAYTTTAADYAEYFRANPADLPQTGEIVMLDGTSNNAVLRAQSSSQAPLVGVVSANPGFVGNGPICNTDDENCDANYAKYNALIALSGQVPVKVNASNGLIAIGDPITASAVAGEGMKATVSSSIVGYAMEPYSAETESGQIRVLIRPEQYTPSATIQGTDKNIANLNVQSMDIASNLNVNGLATLTDLTVTGNATFSGTLTVTKLRVSELFVDGHIVTGGNEPAVIAGSSAGIADAALAIAAPVAMIRGNDTTGTVTITTGANAQAGELVKVKFSTEYSAPPVVNLTPANDNAADLRYYYNATTGEMTIMTKSVPEFNKTYSFAYWTAQ